VPVEPLALITGVGEVAPQRDPGGHSVVDLVLTASRDAIVDAGLMPADVDGLLVAPTLRGAPVTLSSMIAEYLGLRPTYTDLVDIGGATAAGMIWRATAAIAAGACTAVLCVLGEAVDPKLFYQRGAQWFGLPGAEFDRPYGPMGANSGYALIAQRHAYEFGTTDEQRAKVAVDQRTNACANPRALFHGQPITVDDVLASPLVVDPLHLLEIVRPCSGASAFVVTGPGRGTTSDRPEVALLGFGEKVAHASLTQAASLTTSPVRDAATAAFAMAGVGPGDVDLVSVYDCYTITVIVTLEDAGFCEKGQGGPFVADRDLTFTGDLPLNTHGGQLSYGQPGLAGGATHVSEAVYQLRGEAGRRQVRDCKLAYVNGNGGMMSEQCSLVLARTGQ
jgi:acetyl-CoA acetyltransferase